MQRGDVNESKAMYYILQHRWEQRPSGGRVRVVEKAKLVECGPVIFSAFARSTSDFEQELAAARAEGYSAGLAARR